MKLQLIGHDERYVVEQSLMNLFPGERPVYEPITPEDEARVQQAAITAYRAQCCTGCARVDFFFTPEGKIVFNEINTIPGFTSHSRYPAMMAGVGLDFSALVNRLVEGAVGA